MAPAGSPLWLVLNLASGSVDQTAADAVIAALTEAGLPPAEIRRIGEDQCPTRAELEAAGVATLALFAGDGTINQAVECLGDWPGDVLVLPGGTMNMLPKALHGDSTPAAVIAALGEASPRHIPAVQSGDHLAYVSIIAGPLAAWVRPREALRVLDLQRFWQGLRFAFSRLTSPGLRVIGAGGQRMPGRGMAVMISPTEQGLEIVSLTRTGIGTAADIGRHWALGTHWTHARDVEVLKVPEAALVSGGRILALMDGEEHILASPVAVRATFSRVRFLSTRAP